MSDYEFDDFEDDFEEDETPSPQAMMVVSSKQASAQSMIPNNSNLTPASTTTLNTATIPMSSSGFNR